MDLKIVVILHLIALSIAIEVYEDVDEPVLSSRFTRNPKYYQQDMQKQRYYQQQQFDSNNSHRITRREAKANEVSYYTPEKTAMNFGFNHAANLKLLQESFGGFLGQDSLAPLHDEDRQISALTGLIGKAPNTQLQGLEQLLNAKDHTPIMENTVDFDNPQTQPNIKVEPESAVPNVQIQNGGGHQNLIDFAQIEKQLNAAAQVQANEALEKARFASEAHVRAQHEAIARAQAQAQTSALANINFKPTYEHGPTPIQNSEVNAHSDDSNKNTLQYASQYAFGYRVNDHLHGNSFGHEEKHDGNTATGKYHVLLPDGRMQVVNYWADKTGFHAKVTYDTFAKH